MRGPKPWWVLLLLPLLPLWSALSGKAIGPWDQIRQMAPWSGQPSGQPWDVLQADGALQFYVWRDLVFEAWSKFQIPFWNPYELAGTPLLANSQSGALYPPHIVMGVLHIPTQWAILLLAWAHLALAGLGTYRLTRALGANDTGALLAGASFALSPFLVTWTTLASVVSTVAWIPWVLAFTVELTQESEAPRTRAWGGLAACVAMMLLAGHLQFAAYGAIAALVLVLFRYRAGAQVLAMWVGACVIGVAIASPQLVPVLQYGQFSHRRTGPTPEGYQAYAASGLRGWQFGNLVNPQSLGNPREMAGEARVSTYWPALVKPGDNFAESAVSPGAVAVAFLCMLPFFWKSAKRGAGVATVGLIGLLVASGGPIAQAMYFGIPGWASTGSPGRAIVLFVLAACVMAGIAASALFDKETRPRTPKPIQLGALLFVFVTAGTLGIGVSGAQTPAGVDNASFQALVGMSATTGLMMTLVLAAVAVQPALLGYFRSRGPGGSPSVLVVLGVCACALLTNAHTWITTGEPLANVREAIGAKPFERVAFINDPWDLVLAMPATVPPNLAALQRVHELGGYDSLLHRDTVAMLREVDGKDPAPAANGNMMFVKPGHDRDKLGEAGVTRALTMGDGGELVAEDIPGPGRVSLDGGSASIVAENFSSVDVEATGPGELVLRDRRMDGWTATVDGASADLPPGLWMRVQVPAGVHRVRFQYRPPGFVPSAFIALLGVGVLAYLTRKPRASQSASEPLGQTAEPTLP